MPECLRVEVLLFGRLREAAGERSLRVEAPEGATPRRLWMGLETGVPALRGGDRGVRVAVNEMYTDWERPLSEGDVVAFIPPVAGGAEAGGRVWVRLSAEPLDARELELLVRSDGDGAVCTFSGVVRDHHEGREVTALEYEAYAGMAEAEMERAGTEALRRSGARAIALWHRTGLLAVGDASVVVAAAAAHRAAAFDACRLGIDLLKERAPIWKKEHGPAGEVWVEGGGEGPVQPGDGG